MAAPFHNPGTYQHSTVMKQCSEDTLTYMGGREGKPRKQGSKQYTASKAHGIAPGHMR